MSAPTGHQGPVHKNRLANEKSLYLRQHGNNPVDWYPWGPEAFKKAQTENKLVLVSIGYSTCHWCHVMERESFENAEVAKLLNEHFVSIKVDREEHPDVDHFYMQALFTFSGHGGWPLNMVCLPDKRPFFGGTYFPKAQLLQMMGNIVNLWRSESAKILAQADSITDHVKQGNVLDLAVEPSPLSVVQQKFPQWKSKLLETQLRKFDPVWGGFGSAPKFPRPHGTSALLRAALSESDSTKKASALHAVEQTLRGMAWGGLRDHLGGGFHRYSTDAEWWVPHFEKMLYDQAQIVSLYAEWARHSQSTWAADIVEQTLDYLEREMLLEDGLFCSAQDADSEGVEGKHFVWTREQVLSVLLPKGFSVEEVDAFCEDHGVAMQGHWENTNVLHSPLSKIWEELQTPRWRQGRTWLFEKRRTRIAPVTDTKSLLSWNAWMCSGLLQASVSLAQLRPELAARCRDRALKVLSAWDRYSQAWPHVVFQGESGGAAHLEDLAALMEAYQWASQVSLKSEYLDQARRVGTQIRELFWDDKRETWKPSRVLEGMQLPYEGVEDQDGATPASVSVLIGAFVRQSLLDSDPVWMDAVWGTLGKLEKILDQAPIVLSRLLSDLELLSAECVKTNRVEKCSLPKDKLPGQFVWVCSDSPSDIVCTLSECRV